MTRGEHINERAATELQESARDMRRKFIRDAHETVLVALEHQDAEFDAQAVAEQPPTTVTYYVTEDTSHLPFTGPEGQHSLTVYLDGRGGAGGVGQNMRLFVPCPPEVTVDEHTDISAFVQPSFVIVKHVDSTGAVAWYQISPEGIAPHIPDVEAGEHALEDLIAADSRVDELIERAFSRKVEANMGIIALLREELVNMQVAPQRIVTDREILDLTQIT